ncbi:MAG: HmuY family protein [Deltaproteobacteria bacterium]|nr:HmuY family protein [Deltaproteobacteria bacterium]
MLVNHLGAPILIAAAFLGCGIPEKEEPLNVGDGGGHSDHQKGSIDAGVPTSGETLVEATSTADWVYWDFSTGSVSTVTDPAASLDWDLGIRRTQLATNSGTSGKGSAGAVSTGSKDWASITQCPADGYQVDAMLPIPGPPGSGEYSGNPALSEWFNYDPATHAVSSQGLVYCLRTADGKHAKLSIVNYASGQMTIRWRYQPDGSLAVQ